jgi:hypothetical protein
MTAHWAAILLAAALVGITTGYAAGEVASRMEVER